LKKNARAEGRRVTGKRGKKKNRLNQGIGVERSRLGKEKKTLRLSVTGTKGRKKKKEKKSKRDLEGGGG